MPPDDDIKPWTIKGISPEVRNAAIAAAGREGQTIGEWVSRAALGQIQADQGRPRVPAVVAQPQPPAEVAPPVKQVLSLDEITRAALSLRNIDDPKLARSMQALLRGQVRAMRQAAQPPRAPRQAGTVPVQQP